MNKPCPFCGSNNLEYQISTEDREGIPTNILCEDCGCAGPWIYLKPSEIEVGSFDDNSVRNLPKRALELWNGRVEKATVLIDKVYPGEDIYEIERDVVGVIRDSFQTIPVNEDGEQSGTFNLRITWTLK